MKLQDIAPTSQEDAFFISPDSKLIPVGRRHINMIISEPEKFGLTREEVEGAYEKYGERLGMENQAREELMLMLMDKGWIRMRFDPRSYTWIAQLTNFSKQSKEQLFDFGTKVHDGDVKGGKTANIVVLDGSGSILKRGTIQELLDYSLFECSPSIKLSYTLIEEYVPI